MKSRRRSMIIKKLSAMLVMLGMTAVLLTGCGSSKDSGEKKADQSKIHHAEIDIKDYGVIKLELDGNAAPITVDNFIKLASEGFYDGSTFHRIIPDLIMQGGAPAGGNRNSGSEQTIKGEFKMNGVVNGIMHVRGTISMARPGNDMDGASSQFFILQKDYPAWDGMYAGFGHVTEGMDVVDKVCNSAKTEDDNGTVLPENQPVINTIRVID